MLFKPYHVEMITSGRKTQTRRIWDRANVRVGGDYAVTTRWYQKSNGLPRVRVTEIRKERLGEISEADAEREGYGSVKEFIGAWEQINRFWKPEQEVWVVTFELVGKTEGANSGLRDKP